jgi:hypothetical protein
LVLVFLFYLILRFLGWLFGAVSECPVSLFHKVVDARPLDLAALSLDLSVEIYNDFALDRLVVIGIDLFGL